MAPPNFASTLVVPYGLPPPEMAQDLIRSLQAPSLATLLSRNATHAVHPFEADSRVLPHEAWLAHALGLAGDPAAQPAAPFAPAAMRGYGLVPEAGHWFVFHPIHVVVGTHLMMPDLRTLRIDADEARALFDTVAPLFDAPGQQLVYGDAYTWFLRADGWSTLATASPDAATGDNLHPWLPQGASARDFRRLLNEVQMAWHAHPVNAARKQPINSFWLWGGGAAPSAPVPTPLATAAAPGWLNALAAPELRDATAVQWLASPGPHRTAVAGHLIAAGIAEDWGRWLDGMRQLEDQWFAPLLTALRTGQVPDVRLVLTHRHGWTDTRTTRGALRKFWRAQQLNNLITELPT